MKRAAVFLLLSFGPARATGPDRPVATTVSPAPNFASAAASASIQGCRPRPLLVGRELSAEASDRLRLAPGTARLPHAGEYLLRDGRMLAQGGAGTSGVVYRAADVPRRRALLVEDLRFRGVAEGQLFHPMRALIDDGEAFVKEAPALATRFAERLGREHLAADAAGLDTWAARFREGRCQLDPALAQELTAFAGARALLRFEIHRVATAPRFTTRTINSDGKSLVEPIVEGLWKGQRRQLPPFAIAARLLAEDDAHVEALVDDELLATNPPPPPTAPAVPPVSPVSPGGAKASTAPTSATRTPLGDPGMPGEKRE